MTHTTPSIGQTMDEVDTKRESQESTRSDWDSSAPGPRTISSKRPCDVCRKRKIKCIPSNMEPNVPPKPGERCRGCENLDVRCSHDYINKKPGRPLGSTKKVKEERDAKRSSERPNTSEKSNSQREGGAAKGSALPDASYSSFEEQFQNLPDLHRPASHYSQGSLQTSPFAPINTLRPSYSASLLSPTSPYRDSPGGRDGDGRVRAPAEMDLWPAFLDRSAASSVVDTSSPYSLYPGSIPGSGRYDQHTGHSLSSSGYMAPSYEGDRGIKRKVSDGELFSPGQASAEYSGEQNNRYPADDRRRSFSRRSSMSIGRLIQPEQQRAPVPLADHPTGLSNGTIRYGPNSDNRYQIPGGFAHRESFGSAPSDSGIDPSLYQQPPLQPQPRSIFSQPSIPPLSLNIEDIAPWQDICEFLTLYLKYQHALVPIVHKPSFTRDLFERRDKTDPEFRALLLSLVSYVICQVPIAWMPKFTIERLHVLQSECHHASRRIQEHLRKERLHFKLEPTVLTITTLIADYFFQKNSSDMTGAATTLGEAARLAYVKKLHQPVELGQPGEGDKIDEELRRRIFWQLYNTDKTDASGALPIMMHDFEGVPDFPTDTNDDYITKDSVSLMPNDVSYMKGFNHLARLFQILEECLFMKRQKVWRKEQSTVEACLIFIDGARDRVDNLLRNLPTVLRPGSPFDRATDKDGVYSIQRANLLLTAVFVKFELLSFKLAVGVSPQLVDEERKMESSRMFDFIKDTPLDHIAMNGEAMRNKLWAIVDKLTNEEIWNAEVLPWLELLMGVQTLQISQPYLASAKGNSDGADFGG